MNVSSGNLSTFGAFSMDVRFVQYLNTPVPIVVGEPKFEAMNPIPV